jgi:hypothetical protein
MLSAQEREAAKAAWHDTMAAFRQNYTIFNKYAYSEKEAKDAAVNEWKALGRSFGGWKGGGYGQLRSLKPKCDEAKVKIAAKAGLTLATWQHGCGMGQSCFGQTFPTPVTDGTRVYIATAFGSFFCFDKDGKQLWCAFSPGKTGEYCRNGRSPLIYGNLMVSDVTALARGLDRETGKVLWSHPVDEETWMNPVVITAGGKDILLCFNKKAFLLPAGTPLSVEGGTDFGAMAVVKYDERDVVFFTGGGEHGGWTSKGHCDDPPPAAVRFALHGTTLQGTILWKGIAGKPVSGHVGILYHDGKLYHAPTGSIYEPLTGKLLAGNTDPKAGRGKGLTPATGHLLWIAGGNIYGLQAEHGKEGSSGQSGKLVVHTLDGKKVAESTFANAPVEGAKKKQIIEQNGWNAWMFSYGCPFTVQGDRIYIRSFDWLWCVGAR